MSRQRDRIFLPGWWKFWDTGPQWSSTARQRLGVPTPTPRRDDFHLWEAEVRQTPGHLGSGIDADTLAGIDLTATFDTSTPGLGPVCRPSTVDDLADDLAARRRARDAKDTDGGESP